MSVAACPVLRPEVMGIPNPMDNLHMSSKSNTNNDDAPSECPPVGTPEYEKYQSRQGNRAFMAVFNGHPILRWATTAFATWLLATAIWGSWPYLTAGSWRSFLLGVWGLAGLGAASVLFYFLAWNKCEPP
jgi:hypothetical protein